MFHIQESKKNLMRWMHYSFFFFFSRRIFDLWNSKFLVIKAPQKMSRSHWFNMRQRVVVKHPQQYDRQAPSTTSIIKTSNERTPFRISCFIPTVELYTSKKHIFFFLSLICGHNAAADPLQTYELDPEKQKLDLLVLIESIIIQSLPEPFNFPLSSTYKCDSTLWL